MQIVEPLVRQIVTLFKQVNLVVDPDRRMREFGYGADAILRDTFGNEVGG